MAHIVYGFGGGSKKRIETRGGAVERRTEKRRKSGERRESKPVGKYWRKKKRK